MSAPTSELPINIAGLLDKVRRLYPHGIPTAYIVKSSQAPTSVQALRCAFFILRDSVEMNKELHDLMSAICTKGLRVLREDCSVQILVKDATPHEQLEKCFSETSAPLQIVLGASQTPGTTTSTPTGTILYSHSLDLIASDVATKKEFWGHLQSVLPRK